ncbi:hypothetical protein PC116_g30125 [Phytophthora cactorum]|nr:hypothetical protein PC116_g30125 [Phytophthora cactorum]
MTYVATVAVDHLHQRPLFMLVLTAHPKTPASETDGSPRVFRTRRVNDQAIKSWNAQAFSATAVQDGVRQAIRSSELLADDIDRDDLAIERTCLSQGD